MKILLRGGVVATMDPARRVLEADVSIDGDRIVAVGPGIPAAGHRVLDVHGSVVTPGFVQTHVHLCQALFRGMADDLPLMAWLRERIWPLEAAHDEASLRASARLGLAEMLRGGTSTLLDMGTVHHQDVLFEELHASGVRAFAGKAMMDAGHGVPRGLRESTRASLRESDRLRATWDGAADSRLRYAYAPRFILSCSERLFRELAERLRAGAWVHSHAAEHAGEREEVRRQLGKDDVDALRAFGIEGPRVVLAHGVQLTKRQMARAAEVGTRFVHCPSANLKLGSGIANVVGMRSSGMLVGLGADGAPCNNRMDAFTELRQAALLAKGLLRDATALPAMEALAMLTIDGARVLGLEAITGSIEVGKKADITVTDLRGLHALPGHPDAAARAVSTLVYSGTPSDVRHVFVDGAQLVDEGRLTRMDEAAVRDEAAHQGRLIHTRARLR